MGIIKSLIIKWVGKIIAKKLHLKEGTDMDKKKPWYLSKTILTAIVVVLISVYQTVDTGLGPVFGFDLPTIPEWLYAILGAIGIYTRTIADKKIG